MFRELVSPRNFAIFTDLNVVSSLTGARTICSNHDCLQTVLPLFSSGTNHDLRLIRLLFSLFTVGGARMVLSFALPLMSPRDTTALR